ncbi:GNAT family N-acetyltransferase [Sinomonas albida]|uniref:GNAT family N-acetyltransferase n=1 Tax=Sinomonas albida TaxID=369942 RepID=UPI001B3C7DAB|nr:GNAT family N-acetyltransferase [Sinomonas albida]
MVVLLPPSVDLRSAWLEAHAEWGPGHHEDGFGLLETDDIRSPDGFRAFVGRLIAAESMPGAQGGTYRWIAEDGEILGGVALRYENARDVDVLGHIGFGLRPSARGRGIAAIALMEMLSVAKAVGMNRVLLACFLDNLASVKTIQHCGGILDRTVMTDSGEVGRYRIVL